jgi:hypothetical protein
MRSLDNTFGRDTNLPFVGGRQVDLSAPLPGYSLARWRQRSGGPCDGDFSRRRRFGSLWLCRPAPISTNRQPHRRRSHRRKHPSPSSSRQRRRAPPASLRRRLSCRLANRQRASRWIPSASLDSISRPPRAGLGRRISVLMHRQGRSGVISVRIVKSTSTSTSTCRRG